MKVVVEGAKASLYLDHAAKPALLVSNLKYGIWIESGTVAHFKNLKVTHGG